MDKRQESHARPLEGEYGIMLTSTQSPGSRGHDPHLGDEKLENNKRMIGVFASTAMIYKNSFFAVSHTATLPLNMAVLGHNAFASKYTKLFWYSI